MFLSLLFYSGACAALTGLAGTVRPMRALALPTRSRALALAAAGGGAVALALVIPPREEHVARSLDRLDDFLPRWQFCERHEILVNAPAPIVRAAVAAVTPRDIALFRTLTRIRRLGRPGPVNILNVPDDEPILDVATRTGFIWLAQEPLELVVGTVVIAPSRDRIPATPEEFGAIDRLPGFAKAAMNFRLRPQGSATVVTTETRVFATDPSSLRRFTAYWRVIHPGSDLMRRTWLRAIRARAEH